VALGNKTEKLQMTKPIIIQQHQLIELMAPFYFRKTSSKQPLQKGQGLRIQQEAPTKGPGTEDPASNRVQYTRSSNLSTQKDELLVPTFVGLDSDEDPINPFPATPMALIAGPTKTTSSSSSKSPTYSTPTAGTAASIKQLPHAAKPTHQR
jgi:hypothetical protein